MKTIPSPSRRRQASNASKTRRPEPLATLNGKRVRRAAYPRGIELDLYRALRAAVRAWLDETTAAIARWLPHLEAPGPVRRDGLADDLHHLFGRAIASWELTAEGLRATVAHAMTRVSDFNRRQQERVMGGVVNVNVFAHEPWLRDRMALATREAVALVKDIGPKAAGRIERIVTQGVERGHTTAKIHAAIQREAGITRDRAKLIAIDQVGKFNGKLTELRQRAAGVTHYRWRGVLDDRERKAHVAREGQLFSWDDPPSDGHPGEPVRCRCSAEPALDKYSAMFEDPFAE
jgi:SPP1 gp7 family putative phage head morphogenesis protein